MSLIRTAFVPLLLLMALISPTKAQESRGLYVAGMAGVVFADDWDRIIGNTTAIIGADATDATDSAAGFGLRLGYHINRNWALEVGYVEGGETEIQFATVPASFVVDKQYASVSLLGVAPIGERTELYGRIGAAHWEMDITDNVAGFSSTGRLIGNDLLWGAGLNYALTEQIDLTADYQRLQMKVRGGGLSLDAMLVGLRLRFY